MSLYIKSISLETAGKMYERVSTIYECLHFTGTDLIFNDLSQLIKTKTYCFALTSLTVPISYHLLIWLQNLAPVPSPALHVSLSPAG